jgi:hypothetical protein
MEKTRSVKKADNKEKQQQDFNADLFDDEKNSIEEIESDGSGSAFEETEKVTEDNFDDLSEK